MAKIKVSVEKINGYCTNGHLVGDYFYINGSKLHTPDNKYICIWALQSMMPVFPILNEKDKLEDSHWVKSVKTFSCPDPKGKVIFRLEVENDKS